MMKKILPIILCFMFIFSIGVSATNTADTENANPPAASEEMPMQGEKQGGGRGGMGMHPGGENMPSGEMPPAMPDGQMPTGGMTPPQGNAGTATENNQQTQSENGNSAENAPDDATNENANRMPRDEFGGGIGGQGGGFGSTNGNMPENTQNTETTTENTNGFVDFLKTYSTPITAVIMLALAFVFVIFYKRRTY